MKKLQTPVPSAWFVHKTKKRERQLVFYGQGKRARQLQQHKDANPYACNSPAAAWWLAGWNDTDIEANSSEVKL